MSHAPYPEVTAHPQLNGIDALPQLKWQRLEEVVVEDVDPTKR